MTEQDVEQFKYEILMRDDFRMDYGALNAICALAKQALRMQALQPKIEDFLQLIEPNVIINHHWREAAWLLVKLDELSFIPHPTPPTGGKP